MYIRMPEGPNGEVLHTELSVEGHIHTPDEDGLFDIPAFWADYFIKSHGAKRELSIRELQEGIAAMEEQVAKTKAVYDGQVAELSEAKKQVREYAEKAKVKREAKAKAAADAKAKAEADAKKNGNK